MTEEAKEQNEVEEAVQEGAEEPVEGEICKAASDERPQAAEQAANKAKAAMGSAMEGAAEAAKKAHVAVKGELKDHGIDVDVLGSKLAEDVSGLAGAVSRGAAVAAGTVEGAAKAIREKAEEAQTTKPIVVETHAVEDVEEGEPGDPADPVAEATPSEGEKGAE